MPVRLPAGRFKPLTRPAFTGSPPAAKTIGMLDVAAFAASPDGSPPVATITSTCCRAKSVASSGSRSYLPSAQRYSIVTLRPTLNPPSPPLQKSTHILRKGAGRCAIEKADRAHRRLLCPRHDRPRRRCAAEQRDELAPPHVGPLLQARSIASQPAMGRSASLMGGPELF